MITGESKTVAKAPGATVIAGTVVSGGSLRVRATAVGEQTALSGIMRLVAAAQASGSRSQALADRAAAILFYVAIAAGAATFAYWWFVRRQGKRADQDGDGSHHCLPARAGIGDSAGDCNFDIAWRPEWSTRQGQNRARTCAYFGHGDIRQNGNTHTRLTGRIGRELRLLALRRTNLLGWAAAVEANSEHPLAKAIIAEAERRGVPELQSKQIRSAGRSRREGRGGRQGCPSAGRVC